MTGWTYPVIDDITLPDAKELIDYWSSHPPTHILVAAYMGFKSSRRSSGKSSKINQDEQDSSVSAFIGLMGMGGQINVDQKTLKKLTTPQGSSNG